MSPSAATVRAGTPRDAVALARLRYEFRTRLSAPDEDEAALLERCIAWIYVRAEARGTGVGTALLDAALGWCAERGVHAVMLWPTQRSRPLYGRHGFAPPASLMELIVTGDGAPWPTTPRRDGSSVAGGRPG